MTKLKLEVGKYYRTRDGQKVGPILIWSERALNKYSDHETDGTDIWKDNGRRFSDVKSDTDLIAEWTDTPEVGTLAEIGADVGDVVEWQDLTYKPYMTVDELIQKHDGEGMLYDCSIYGRSQGYFDTQQFRIISRASDAKSSVELSVDLGEAIKQVVAESQSGPVQLRKVIVPGVYGKVVVCDGDELCVVCDSMRTRADLIAAYATIGQLIDAMPDSAAP